MIQCATVSCKDVNRKPCLYCTHLWLGIVYSQCSPALLWVMMYYRSILIDTLLMPFNYFSCLQFCFSFVLSEIIKKKYVFSQYISQNTMNYYTTAKCGLSMKIMWTSINLSSFFMLIIWIETEHFQHLSPKSSIGFWLQFSMASSDLYLLYITELWILTQLGGFTVNNGSSALKHDRWS